MCNLFNKSGRRVGMHFSCKHAVCSIYLGIIFEGERAGVRARCRPVDVSQIILCAYIQFISYGPKQRVEEKFIGACCPAVAFQVFRIFLQIVQYVVHHAAVQAEPLASRFYLHLQFGSPYEEGNEPFKRLDGIGIFLQMVYIVVRKKVSYSELDVCFHSRIQHIALAFSHSKPLVKLPGIVKHNVLARDEMYVVKVTIFVCCL